MKQNLRIALALNDLNMAVNPGLHLFHEVAFELIVKRRETILVKSHPRFRPIFPHQERVHLELDCFRKIGDLGFVLFVNLILTTMSERCLHESQNTCCKFNQTSFF